MFKDDIVKAISLYEADELLDAIKNSENLETMIYTTVHHSTIKSLAILNFIPEDLVIFHDLDKLVMLLFHDRETVSTEHRRTIPHHDTSTTDENTLIEMMLDWESARLTKPDKPLNAYMTLKKYYPQMTERMMPILKKYKLDKEIESNPLSYQKYEEITKDVTPEMIEKLIVSYLINEPIRFLSDPEYLLGFKDIINKKNEQCN